jgi:hypothetical protein
MIRGENITTFNPMLKDVIKHTKNINPIIINAVNTSVVPEATIIKINTDIIPAIIAGRNNGIVRSTHKSDFHFFRMKKDSSIHGL